MRSSNYLFPLFILLLLSACGKQEQNEHKKVTPLTAATFDATIKKGIVLVDFWGDWCIPCKTQSMIVAEIAAEMGGKGLRVANLDLGPAEAREKAVSRYKLEYVPTLIIFKKGDVFTNFVGLTQKETIIEAINDAKGQTKKR